MSQPRTAFIIAKPGFDVYGDTMNMVIDSRRSTFKYIDRSEYKNGVYPVTATGVSFDGSPLQVLVIPHTLNYPPSVRVYAAGIMATPGTGTDSLERIVKDVSQVGSTPRIIASSDAKNIYLDVMEANTSTYPTFDILLLIGADNLDSKADEDVYL